MGLTISSADNYAVGVPLAAFGAFLALQASRVKFRFDDEALEVVSGEAQERSDNSIIGGANRWPYSSFTNWELWWPGFPVLVYFKETQTRPEGQPHFFPVRGGSDISSLALMRSVRSPRPLFFPTPLPAQCIFDGEVLHKVMVERCGSTTHSRGDK